MDITTKWVKENFPPGFRRVEVILTMDNVLTPEAFQLMRQIDDDVASLVSPNGHRLSDFCVERPVSSSLSIMSGDERRKRSSARPSERCDKVVSSRYLNVDKKQISRFYGKLGDTI